MEKKTLRQFLDENGIGPGNNEGFVLATSLFSRTEMQVSRRYLEGPAWKHLLDKNVLGVIPYQGIYGETIKIFLSD